MVAFAETCDLFGNLTQISDADNDSVGNRRTVLDPNSLLVDTTYDAQNRVRLVTNAANEVTETIYNAYGKQTVTSATGAVRAKSAVGFDRGFTGYVADNETGLDYARARMYSPTLGRFVGRDSCRQGSSLDGYHDGANLYGAYYVPNMLDPLGQEKLTVDLGNKVTIELDVQIDCPEYMIEGIKKHLIEAVQTLSRANVALQADPAVGVKRWYGERSAKNNNFSLVAATLLKTTKYSFKCEDCCDVAKVRSRSMPIIICLPNYIFYGSPLVIIHELTHIGLSSNDYGYGGPDSYSPGKDANSPPPPLKDGEEPKPWKPSDGELLKNADTFAGWLVEIGAKK